MGCGLEGCWVGRSSVMHSGLMVSGWLGVRIRGSGDSDVSIMAVGSPSSSRVRDHPRPVSEPGKDGVFGSMTRFEISTVGSV